MAFQPIRDEAKKRVRFLVDEERGVIRHKSRDGDAKDYRIEPRENQQGYRVVPVEEREIG